jgi:hypothetical protein
MNLDRGPNGWKMSREELHVVHQTGNRNFVSDLRRLTTGQP